MLQRNATPGHAFDECPSYDPKNSSVNSTRAFVTNSVVVCPVLVSNKSSKRKLRKPFGLPPCVVVDTCLPEAVTQREHLSSVEPVDFCVEEGSTPVADEDEPEPMVPSEAGAPMLSAREPVVESFPVYTDVWTRLLRESTPAQFGACCAEL
jgi:hypothetical protein